MNSLNFMYPMTILILESGQENVGRNGNYNPLSLALVFGC